MVSDKIKASLKYYFSNLLFVWIAILIYRSNSYYTAFLRPETQYILLYMATAYTFTLPIYLFLKNPSKGYIALIALKKMLIGSVKIHDERFVLERHEKNALLFTMVKFFFLPIMLNFFLNNYFSLMTYSLKNITISQSYFLYPFFPMAFTFLFAIDTLWFSFSYAFESGFLKNKVRSVDPTFFGWFVALISYPPFNTMVNNYIGWYPNDYIELSHPSLTMILRIFILIFIGIYVWATLALGTKCSNLTNRGIVSKGPYSFIRHPAYVCKNLAWWLTIIPIMSLPVFFSMLTWSIIYYFRAVTEERHLIADPDYQAYCKKVKYKFIPYIF